MLALLQQLLTYQGYFDEHLEWIGIENIQFIGSMSVQSASSRSPLPARLFSSIRVFSVASPSESNLNLIYSSYLGPILEPVLKSSGRIETIALSIVQLFEELKKSFKAADRIHYDFSPRDVTRLVTALLRYELQEEANIDSALLFEAERTFRDRLVSEEDRQKFDEVIANAMPFARNRNKGDHWPDSGRINARYCRSDLRLERNSSARTALCRTADGPATEEGLRGRSPESSQSIRIRSRQRLFRPDDRDVRFVHESRQVGWNIFK